MREPIWSVSRSVPPDDAPLSLDQAKAQCRVGDDIEHDDPLIEGYALVAADVVEQLTERALLTQTWIRTATGFPPDDREPIVLPRPPLQAVEAVQYRDTSGQLQTWDPSKYRVITVGQFGAIVPAFGEGYPRTSGEADAVTITFRCGWEAVDNIPARYMLAQQQLVAHWYANGEPVDVSDLPLGLAMLVGAPARVDPCA